MTPRAMTSHLTPEELIDSRERQLAPARQSHAHDCVVCRAKLAELDETLRDVATVDIPEPSPLFWDHLAARIRDRVAHEPPPAPARENPLSRLGGWLPGWSHGWSPARSTAPRWAFAAALLALCASLGWFGWSELRHDRTAPAAVPRTASSAPAPDVTATSAASTDDLDGDWALMLHIAEEVSWDETEASSLDVRPAAVDHALVELTPEERGRLLQLVQADLARQNKKS